MAHPSKRNGRGLELDIVTVLQRYTIEAVKIPLSGLVTGLAGNIGAGLTKQDILNSLRCRP